MVLLAALKLFSDTVKKVFIGRILASLLTGKQVELFSRTGNTTIHHNSICCCCTWHRSDPALWRSERGGEGESCLHNDFFPSVTARPRSLWMELLFLFLKVGKLLYKCIWHNVSSLVVGERFLDEVWVGCYRKDLAAWAHFSSCKPGCPYFKKLVRSGTKPLLDS